MITLYPEREHFVHFTALAADPANWRALSDDENPWEQTVADFVSKLQRLLGIPFRYFVPSDSMLPAESIRFFYIDPNWVSALTDGALSLGRIGIVDTQHDTAMTPVIAARAEALVLNARRIRLAQAPVDEPPAAPIYAGFLMRSALVSGWPGLEVQAKAAAEGSGVGTKCTGDDAQLVRMDRLAPDVLLCLFDRSFGCVNIHEPKEGINFGAKLELEPTRYSKQLRGLGINGYTIAEFIEGAVVPVPLRSADSRVVSVDDLRKSMAAKLRSLNPPAWTESDAKFTSAQFSLQMIEGASQQIFRADDPPAPPVHAAGRLSTASRRIADRARLNAFLFPVAEAKP
jgi:hypothetical protein